MWYQTNVCRVTKRIVGVGLSSLLLPVISCAYTAPEQTGMGFAVYDMLVNNVLKGPLGTIGAILLIVFSAVHITDAPKKAVLGLVAGTAIIQADHIVTALGMVI